MKLLKNLKSATVFHKAVKAMQAGDYADVISRLDGFEGQPYFEAKAELFRAMARHRQNEFAEAVQHYEAFLAKHLENMPAKDRSYVGAYAKFFKSRAKARLDPSTPLYSSLDELRKLAAKAPFLTRAEFSL